METSANKTIITVVGKDTVGIIAKVCTYLANNRVNVMDISQTIVQGFFNMMMIVDLSGTEKPFADISKELAQIGEEIGVDIKCQREEIFEKNAQNLRRDTMINIWEVNETNKMIEHENLDVRTITLGISLLDCIDTDLAKVNENIYRKITTVAKDLVKVGKEIENKYCIPIVNKRISITPISLIGASACKTPEDYVTIAKTLDDAAREVGVNFIGGYSALVSKGMTKSDELLIRSIPQALAETEYICSSVNVGSTKTGINMDAVRLMGDVILQAAEYTKENDSLGCAKLVVLCNAPDDNPFMAGAFHGVTEADAIINVGVSGPGVVKTALEKVRGENFEVLCETIKKTAFKVTRVGQLVAQEASRKLGIPFGIIDLSLAPTPAIGDSVAEILEEIGLEYAGAPGTTAALALLNDQVKKGGVMASSYVGGLSGAFIPVSEDQGMIDAVTAGALSLEKLEAMTCVCSVGLDMIAIPGDTKATTISGIIADEMAIGMINQKTTAVRIIPVIGKGVGETVEFGGLLGYAPIMPVNKYSCDAFVNRGGRIPAPIHSFKN
ncbi:MAG: ACT domain-containing protein [Clostridia bacterium]